MATASTPHKSCSPQRNKIASEVAKVAPDTAVSHHFFFSLSARMAKPNTAVPTKNTPDRNTDAWGRARGKVMPGPIPVAPKASDTMLATAARVEEAQINPKIA